MGRPIWGSSCQVLFLHCLETPAASGSSSRRCALQAPPSSRTPELQAPQLQAPQALSSSGSGAMNMNQTFPLGQPNRAFPPGNYDLLSEEPGLRPPGQDPASTTISVHSYEPPPKDFFVWSVFNTLYMNFCCLGFMALVFSVKARDRKLVGDLHAAQSYGATAKCLNICALTFSLLLVALVIILVATGVIIIRQVAMSQDNNPHFPDLFSGN